MSTDRRQLHILFFPLMAPGHTLPMVDMAKLFARRGVRSTILTTPSNAASVVASLGRRASEAGHAVETLLVEIPPAEAGVPKLLADATTAEAEMDFLMSTVRLRDPFERLLREHRPDAVVSDMFFPWSGEVAEELGVPRLIFHGTSFFSLCVMDAVFHHPPPESSDGDDGGLYAVPGLPHRIELHRSQLPDFREQPEFLELFVKTKQSEKVCFGVVVNSFYELEPEYADHYRKAMGKKAWHVGPVSLCDDDDGDRSARGSGAGAAVDADSCLSWLASKEPSSVVYVCFGSLLRFTAAQLREIALGLEASGHPFIWVVREYPAGKAGGASSEQWLPEGFEERTAGRGMVIRGWAPQILLLNHEAVGGFVTHCGWNSCLEGITAGLPMVAWPMFADQFYNERLLVEVLGVGVSMGGPKRYSMREDERPLVVAEEVARAVEVLMGGGGERRRRARELREAARAAMREGGSSYDDMGRLIEELLGKKTAPVHAGD